MPPEGLGYYSPELLRGEEVTPSAGHLRARDDRAGPGQRPRRRPPRRRRDRPGHRRRPEGPVPRRGGARACAPRSPRTAHDRGPPASGARSATRTRDSTRSSRPTPTTSSAGTRWSTRLVARLAEPVEGARFLAVVGPSGSGKSSAVRAGLIPTLRAGALPGSDRWFYVEMLPGVASVRRARGGAAADRGRSAARTCWRRLERSERGSRPGRRAHPARRRDRARARRGPARRGLHDGRGRAAPEPVPPEPRRRDAGTRRPAPGRSSRSGRTSTTVRSPSRSSRS